jgi:transposase-like protein
MLKIVDPKGNVNQEIGMSSLDELAREGARRMLMSALEAEAQDFVERNRTIRNNNQALIVRNGHSPERSITIGNGTIKVKAPRVRDNRHSLDERVKFVSSILPPYMRRSPKVNEVLPVLYLRGLSTGDFSDALSHLLGEDASGLSSSNITRLTNQWETDYESFKARNLSLNDYIYVWVDGIHFNVRLEDDRLCTLVMIGARRDGTKELLALEDGYRESKESWLSLLRNLTKHGMHPPLVAVGDGALGFWAALKEVWPETREQSCWVHKLANVLDKLPKRLQGKAKEMLHAAMYADTRAHAEEAFEAFEGEFGIKHERAVSSLFKSKERLFTLFDFPGEHWVHLRTTNPIESTFATVRLRQRVTKGAGTRKKALLMAFKLLDMAQRRWRKLNAPHRLVQVSEGVKFVDGLEVKNQEKVAA